MLVWQHDSCLAIVLITITQYFLSISAGVTWFCGFILLPAEFCGNSDNSLSVAGASSCPSQFQVINITLQGTSQGLRGPVGPGQSSSAWVDLWGCLVVCAALVGAGNTKLIWRDVQFLTPISNASGSTKPDSGSWMFAQMGIAEMPIDSK